MDITGTCGQGLAENSLLPFRLGDLMSAMAGVLEQHISALDSGDPTSRPELSAYRSLVEKHQRAAEQLSEIGREMAGYRDLPMAKHDLQALQSSMAAEAFESFVQAKEEVLQFLQMSLEEDRRMLSQHGSARADKLPE